MCNCRGSHTWLYQSVTDVQCQDAHAHMSGPLCWGLCTSLISFSMYIVVCVCVCVYMIRVSLTHNMRCLLASDSIIMCSIQTPGALETRCSIHVVVLAPWPVRTKMRWWLAHCSVKKVRLLVCVHCYDRYIWCDNCQCFVVAMCIVWRENTYKGVYRAEGAKDWLFEHSYVFKYVSPIFGI